MNLWAVTMVRDEIDVIADVLRHTASEGITGLIVADNMSVDGTWEWLQDNAAELPCEVVLRRDTEVGYYQSAKMTRLVAEAAGYGAEWVWPFDADEIWFNAEQPLTVAQTIDRDGRRFDCVTARLFNHFPTSTDDPAEPNPFRRIIHRDETGSTLRKVIVRARPDVVIEQGNHDATGGVPFRRVGTDLQVGHFPWRSHDQFITKCRNGYEAYRATDLPEHMGSHWRQYGELLEQGGPQVLVDVYDEWFSDPDIALRSHPVPFCRFG